MVEKISLPWHQYLKPINLIIAIFVQQMMKNKCRCILWFRLKWIRWRHFWRVIKWWYYWWYSCQPWSASKKNWDNQTLMFNRSIVKLQMHWMFLAMKKLQRLILISSMIQLTFSEISSQTPYYNLSVTKTINMLYKLIPLNLYIIWTMNLSSLLAFCLWCPS